jgi:hypothetical protein
MAEEIEKNLAGLQLEKYDEEDGKCREVRGC